MRRLCCPLALTLAVLVASQVTHADAPVSCGRAFWTVPPVSSTPTPETLLAQGWAEASAFTGLMNLSSRQMSRSQPVFWIGA